MTLKLKMQARSISLLDGNIERLILPAMLWSFLACALLYIGLLGTMVFNIVERKALEADARVLSNEVGGLELSYISMSNGISLDLSHSLGFKETKINFATRKPLGSLDSVKISKNEI